MNPESSKSLPTTFVVPSEEEYPHDNSVLIEGKGKRITLDQQAHAKTELDMHPDDSQKNIEASVGETSNKIAMATPATTAETSSPLITSISAPRKPQIATSSTETKSESSQSDLLDVYTNESAPEVSQAKTCMPYVSKELEDDDLIRLFQIMEEGADMEVHMPYASKITTHEDDSEVTKALEILEASLKMGLNVVASSEESRLSLENALNTLSSRCSHDGLKAMIHSLQQEIQTVLPSFKQASATIGTMTKLEQKEKLMIEERLQRKEATMTLLSEILKTKNSMVEAQAKEKELKEQISKLQDQLYSKEKEIKKYKIKLLSLQEQKKKTVSDTIGFIKELEAVKKEWSHIMDSRIKARNQLENVEANLKKASLLLGVHLKHEL